jgi:lipid-binding SYLF domain-containing protein
LLRIHARLQYEKGGGAGERDCESLSEAFSKSANVTLGGNLSISAGPLGRAAEAGVGLQSAIYSYSRSQGFFAGVSLEGTVEKLLPTAFCV